jgi:hypothetical protein
MMKKYINSYSVSLVVIAVGGFITNTAIKRYYVYADRNSDYVIAWLGAALIIAGLITLTINDIFKKP